jgi:hypothetical protein
MNLYYASFGSHEDKEKWDVEYGIWEKLFELQNFFFSSY